jgi:hypothetical protein
LIGGGNRRLLRWAARHADLIGLSGLGRTLEDGHRHEAKWRGDQIDANVELCGDKPVEALVQRVIETDDAGAAYAAYAKESEQDEADVTAAPYVLMGTQGEMAAKLAAIEHRWGITRFTVRVDAIDAIAGLI